MKKVFNVFMGIIVFGALLVAGVLISARKMLSPSNMTNLLNIVAKDKGDYDKFTDAIFDEMDSDFSDYVDEKDLEKAVSKYMSSYFEVLAGKKDEMDSDDLVKVLNEASKEYNEDHNGKEVSKNEIEEAVDSLGKELDKSIDAEIDVKKLFEFIYSNTLVIAIIVAIVALGLIYIVSKSLDKVFFHLGLNATITGLLTTLAAGAIGKVLEAETNEKVAELLNENLVGNIRTVGIIGIVVGVVCIVISVLLKIRNSQPTTTTKGEEPREYATEENTNKYLAEDSEPVDEENTSHSDN